MRKTRREELRERWHEMVFGGLMVGSFYAVVLYVFGMALITGEHASDFGTRVVVVGLTVAAVSAVLMVVVGKVRKVLS